jgi:allophanate hydrolase subunit 2
VDVSRIGIRLRPAGAVAAGASLPSLGVLPGAIQVLPSGDWVVLGPDAGTMGGYPIVGVVVSADLGRLAHVAPGQVLQLLPVAAGDAPRPVLPRILRLGALRG